MNPEISVILCTHNPREEYLRRTMEGLDHQTLDARRWELLVVDNASEPKVRDFNALHASLVGHLIYEPEPGLARARLAGIKESSGELLVFVDDDTVLAPDYLERVIDVSLEWPFIGAWSGDIKPEYETPLPDWVKDQVWRLTVMEVKADSWSNLKDFTTCPVGAGMCVRRSVSVLYTEECEANLGHLRLDRIGAGLGGYGDADLAFCALDMGLGCGRSSKLHLTHLIPSSRLTQEYFDRHSKGEEESLKIFKELRGVK